MAQKAFVEDALPKAAKRPMRPVDLVHLAKQCLGDENLELEILRLFDTTLVTYFDRLQLDTPRVLYDLPGGGRRLVQACRGILTTLLSGVEGHESMT